MNTWSIKQDQVLGNLPSTDTVQLSHSLGERRNTRLEERMELDRRRGEEIDTGSVDSFQRTEVSSLISEWESRARGGEGMQKLELPEESDHGRGRRMSQEFKQIRQKFVEVGEDTRIEKNC